MIFRNLTMAGFKSFAEKADMDIEEGLTGIVGPNGCGKSNIVEGLRWIMGESSARQMRGTELDDIIFSGTDNRPARNFAEISLRLDNQDKRAPVEFNEHDDLEITRRVERGKGTQFQINGKPARAKDVQLLFADSATGARSAGIVSQGRIGAIVGAKPEDRRSLIEEAANIKGLHQRKHEAELRLRNTETNLARLEDLIGQLAEQKTQLAKQARQAARYRSVADRIRKAEARLFHARWRASEQALSKAKTDYKASAELVETASADVARLSAQQARLTADVPPLRDAEAEQGALVQTLRIRVDDCGREQERVTQALDRLTKLLEQIDRDATRETTLKEDAQQAIAGLQAEQQKQQDSLSEHAPQLEQARADLSAAQTSSRDADELAAKSQARLAAAQQNRDQLTARLDELNRRIDTLTQSLAQLNLDKLQETVTSSAQDLAACEASLATGITDHDAVEAKLAAARDVKDKCAEDKRDTDTQLARLVAEIDALSYLLAEPVNPSGTPVADQISVEEGMEVALAACLGSDLSLPYDSGETGYWRQDITGAPADAPDVGTPFARFISHSDVLKQALSGVSLIEDSTAAEQAQNQLSPGQALVSKDGTLWRWDGLVRKGPVSNEAERIRQRQRLDALQAEADEVKTFAEAQGGKLAQANADLDNLQAERQTTQQALQAARRARDQAKQTADDAQIALKSAAARSEDLTHALELATGDRQSLLNDEGFEADLETLAQQANELSTAAEAARTRLNQAVQQEAELAMQLKSAEQQQQSSVRQIADWQNRLGQTDRRLTEMDQRRKTALTEKEQLESRPEDISRRQHQLMDQLESAEAERLKRSDHLREAEEALRQADLALRESERELSSKREALIRTEALSERYQTEQEGLSQRIREKLDCGPADLAELAQLADPDEPHDTLEKLELSVNRLLNERDQIGPVNLRAEVEMEEIDRRVTSLTEEHDDLVEAIAKLRSAIAALNREGRARLMDSFAAVNKHFTELFTTLFGGGHAELRLINSDDPLQAGIDILASPPGKKMQSLSLLSGGEQALTALAIIFAVFLTNPAPICVLDEVDAPLDDSNVSRFCDLLKEIAERTNTRFLVVTHHRMTMARMDRLFGVTMEQKGVSRLVTVDLQTAETMRDPLTA